MVLGGDPVVPEQDGGRELLSPGDRGLHQEWAGGAAP